MARATVLACVYNDSGHRCMAFTSNTPTLETHTLNPQAHYLYRYGRTYSSLFFQLFMNSRAQHFSYSRLWDSRHWNPKFHALSMIFYYVRAGTIKKDCSDVFISLEWVSLCFLWFEVLRILRKSKDFGVLLIWIFIVLFLWNNLYWFFFLFRFFYRCFFLLGSLDNRHFELFILFPLMNCYGKCLIFMQSGNPRWWILKRVRISFSKVNVLFEHTGAQPPCPPPSLPFSSSSSPLYIAEFSSLFHFYPSSSYITFSILLSSFFIALALSLNFFVPPDTAARSCPSC